MFWTRNPEPAPLLIGDRPLRVERSARLKRMRLSVDARKGDVVLKLPPGVSLKAGQAFAASNRDWIMRQQASLQHKACALQPGDVLELDGRSLVITHVPGGPRAPRLSEERLLVGGPRERVAQRIERWLINRAKADLTARVQRFAALRHRPPPPVTLRDTRSRWGSCSRTGRISLCWRLIGAPAFVRDYVCAHEVAHLAHMNHSPAFWAEVASMDVDAAAARRWLRQYGNRLLRLGHGG